MKNAKQKRCFKLNNNNNNNNERETKKRNVTIRKKIEKNTHKYIIGILSRNSCNDGYVFLKINTFKKVCHFSCARVVPY